MPTYAIFCHLYVRATELPCYETEALFWFEVHLGQQDQRELTD